MSDTNQTTCPVCFTKMRNINKVLTCPECGYKYCDHSRDLQNMFDTTHTHAPNYTTYTNSGTSTRNTQTTTGTTRTSGQTTYTQTTVAPTHTGSGTTNSKTSVKKVVKIIVIIYLIISFGPFVCSALGIALTAIISNFAKAPTEDFPVTEVVVSSDLPAEVTESIDIDSLLENIHVTTPVSIEYEDGEFVTELIKHIFDVSDCEDVTAEDLSSIYWLEIYRDTSDCLYANYYFNDGNTGKFTSDITELRGANLNAFADLEQLDSPDITYAAGDLKNLTLLRRIGCQNAPATLITVVSSPQQFSELHLYIPSNTNTLAGLEYFSELRTLEISAQNSNVIDAGQIADLDNLDSLSYVDAGALRDFSFLSELPSINYLLLNAPSLPNLNFVYNMPELRNLTFFSSDVTDLQPLTAAADTLTALDMSFNPYITDYSALSEMTKLEYLYLDYCDLTDLSFASDMENLASLSIQSTQVTSLEPLKDLSYLINVQTRNTPIEDYAGLEHLCEN